MGTVQASGSHLKHSCWTFPFKEARCFSLDKSLLPVDKHQCQAESVPFPFSPWICSEDLWVTSFGWHEDQQQRPRPAAHCTRPQADCKDIQHFVGLSSRYHRQPWWGLCNDNAYDSMPWRWWYGLVWYVYDKLFFHVFSMSCSAMLSIPKPIFSILKIISVCHLKSPPKSYLSYPHALHITPYHSILQMFISQIHGAAQTRSLKNGCCAAVHGFPMLCIRWLPRQMRFARNVRSNANCTNCKRSIATYPWPFIWSKFLSFCR